MGLSTDGVMMYVREYHGIGLMVCVAKGCWFRYVNVETFGLLAG